MALTDLFLRYVPKFLREKGKEEKNVEGEGSVCVYWEITKKEEA